MNREPGSYDRHPGEHEKVYQGGASFQFSDGTEFPCPAAVVIEGVATRFASCTFVPPRMSREGRGAMGNIDKRITRGGTELQESSNL